MRWQQQGGLGLHVIFAHHENHEQQPPEHRPQTLKTQTPSSQYTKYSASTHVFVDTHLPFTLDVRQIV